MSWILGPVWYGHLFLVKFNLLWSDVRLENVAQAESLTKNDLQKICTVGSFRPKTSSMRFQWSFFTKKSVEHAIELCSDSELLSIFANNLKENDLKVISNVEIPNSSFLWAL